MIKKQKPRETIARHCFPLCFDLPPRHTQRAGRRRKPTYWALAICFARRAFLRLAVFLCRMPLAAALSIAEVVRLYCAAALAGAVAIYVSNILMAVLTFDFTIRFRRFLASLTFTRLIADLMFGNVVHLLGS